MWYRFCKHKRKRKARRPRMRTHSACPPHSRISSPEPEAPCTSRKIHQAQTSEKPARLPGRPLTPWISNSSLAREDRATTNCHRKALGPPRAIKGQYTHPTSHSKFWQLQPPPSGGGPDSCLLPWTRCSWGRMNL